MSAYIVHRAHVEFLTEAAVSVNSGRKYNYGPFTYYHNGSHHSVGRLDHAKAAEVGQMLWAENAKSVAYRYNEEPAPLHYREHRANPASLEAKLTPAQVFMALDGYEYQTCEHPGWPDSEAHSFCVELRRQWCHNVDGYDDAEWSIAPQAQDMGELGVSVE